MRRLAVAALVIGLAGCGGHGRVLDVASFGLTFDLTWPASGQTASFTFTLPAPIGTRGNPRPAPYIALGKHLIGRDWTALSTDNCFANGGRPDAARLVVVRDAGDVRRIRLEVRSSRDSICHDRFRPGFAYQGSAG